MWGTCYNEAPQFVGRDERKRQEYAILCVYWAEAERKVKEGR